jgi:hypothetical protein
VANIWYHHTHSQVQEQGMEVKVALVTNEVLDNYCLLVPTVLASLDVEILCPKKGACTREQSNDSIVWKLSAGDVAQW